jgi:hypothetical protein
MSDDSFSWHDILDRIVFFREPILWRKLPPLESKDGQEPAVESLREEARQADAKLKTEKPRKLTSQDAKSLDKEFWDTM